MAITVGDIYKALPNITESQVRQIVGSTNFDKDTPVPLTNIVNYKGPKAMDLSIFVAGKEGRRYTDLLSDNKKSEIASTQPKLAQTMYDNNSKNLSYAPKLPMDVSVFSAESHKQFT